MKRKSLVLVLSLVCLAGIGGAAFFCLAEAASEEGFDKMTKGMTKIEVQRLLGKPLHVISGTHNSTRFLYGGLSTMRWCAIDVIFGEDARVIGKFHDH